MNRSLIEKSIIRAIIAYCYVVAVNYKEAGYGAPKPKPPVCCALNSTVDNCVTECNIRSCASLTTPPKPNCSTDCYPVYCQCAVGYYSNDCYECVLPQDCDIPCTITPITCPGQNEELIECYDPREARICDPTIRQPSCSREKSPFSIDSLDVSGWNDKPGQDCILQICDCKEGFKRNKYGICVEAKDCWKEIIPTKNIKCSDSHEVRLNSYHPCKARTCENLIHPPGPECYKKYNTLYHERCECDEGYYRDTCGRCVETHICKAQTPCKCTDPCIPTPHSSLKQVNTCLYNTCYTQQAVGLECNTDVYIDCNCGGGYYFNQSYYCVKPEDCTQSDVEITKGWILARDLISYGEN